MEKGLGFWKVHNSSSNDETYVNLNTANYLIICGKHSLLNNTELKWEMVKMEIQSSTIPYSKSRARNARNFEKAITFLSIRTLKRRFQARLCNNLFAYLLHLYIKYVD